ncbi:fimbrillin family protein [Sphingobacterium multivorum]|uniref:fimbrillin family protein n=1 Tax=Sphingobacterium multivorum TaxID=28454 RepID=UPI0031BA90BF
MIKLKRFLNSIPVKTALLFLAAGISLFSCKRDDNTTTASEGVVVKVKMEGIASEDPTPIKIGSTNAGTGSQNSAQQAIIPFGNNLSLVATLTPTVSSQGSLQASSRLRAAGSTTDKMDSGKKYTVLVYETASGNYVSQKTYTTGSEQAEGNITGLAANTSYDFVVVSYNDVVAPSWTDTQSKSSEAVLTGVNGNTDLMYFKTTMTVSNVSANQLNITLKHKFSQITTKIDASTIGNISAVSANIAPHYPTANIKLSDAALSYNGSATSAQVPFSALGSSIVSSVPTLVCIGTAAPAVFNIPSITINGVTKSNLQVSGLRIAPGVKYNLNLTIKASDGVQIGNLIWAKGNLAYNGPSNGTGTYSFDDPSHLGLTYEPTHYWRFDSNLIPDDGTRPSPPNPFDNNICAKMGAGWRIPTFAEFQTLVASPLGGGTNNPSGQADDSPLTSYIFFNASNGDKLYFYKSGTYKRNGGTAMRQKGFGGYQISDGGGNGTGNINVAVFDGGTLTFSLDSENIDDRYPIRCVKDVTP